MKIWAHRGRSLQYPENTLPAFRKAAELRGLTGIELDVQLTADKQPVVIHDETVDRTTNGSGAVKDYLLKDLKKLRIKRNWLRSETVPTLAEVLEALEKPMSNGLLLNIELKNGVTSYQGMEKIIVEMIRAHGLRDRVIYSSFNGESLKILRRLEPDANIGVLDGKASGCLAKIKDGCPANAIHPCWRGLDAKPQELAGFSVRAYGAAPLFPEKGGKPLDLGHLEALGATDVFINDPETFLAPASS